MPSIAELRDKFKDQITALADAGTNVAEALDGTTQLKWCAPDKGDWDGDLNDLEAISQVFDRDENSQDVIDAFTKKGAVGDLTASALQADTLAAMERAYRARMQSSVRSKIHAAVRRKGHGHENGPLKGGIKGYAENILTMAKTSNKEEA